MAIRKMSGGKSGGTDWGINAGSISKGGKGGTGGKSRLGGSIKKATISTPATRVKTSVKTVKGVKSIKSDIKSLQKVKSKINQPSKAKKIVKSKVKPKAKVITTWDPGDGYQPDLKYTGSQSTRNRKKTVKKDYISGIPSGWMW
jgi:copper chaperone CopZ